MKMAVICANGKEGRLIVEEAMPIMRLPWWTKR